MSNKVSCAVTSLHDPHEAASSAALQAKAVRMHRNGRLRSKHFYTPVMADRSMDVMLTLFVGELQSCTLSETALAVGNMLSREELRSVTDKLIQAGLVLVSGAKHERRTVGLSALGSARMRSFVSDYPDV